MKDILEMLEGVKGYLDGADKGQWEALKVIDEAIAALSADAEVEAEFGVKNEWQPIETAPNDGSNILGFIPSEILGGCKIDHKFATMYYDKDSDDFWTSNPGGYAADGYLSGNPTHWMPLPTPPKDTP